MLPKDSKPWNTLVFLIFLFISFHQSLSDIPNLIEHTWQEAFKALGISWNPDGTLNRSILIPMVDPTPDADSNSTAVALSQDIYLSPYNKAYICLYIPVNPPKNQKLPLIIYFHGGDFVLFSASTLIFHNFCNDISSQFPAVVVSVEYRLAPEHRLPTAYDDALHAIAWVREQALGIGGRDPWLEYADFSRVFLLGSSAGANIAYHVALRAMDFDFTPLQIKGLLLNQAYFGGLRRTRSEIRLIDDPYVPLYVNDVLWSLALPKNLNRDHEFCNPISGGTYLGRVFRLPKVYIKGDFGDPLVDRSVQLLQFLQSCKVRVYYRFNRGGHHGIELQNTTAAQQLYNDMRWFVYDVDIDVKSEDLSSGKYVNLNTVDILSSGRASY
ncbi:Arylacetamide deacetylase [Handroanthus impetiginosus]|uniref:Arylacetamide deacetylase n=1 Tax=Handroanthus impetiginosus TaxID=429701 RepID=A0A2G9GGS7_9LAMI|nr:Arylacetamide deacetylase [Handroanthus impetiginosus]